MDLSPYLDTLRRELVASAAPGGSDVRHAADLLTGSLDAAARLTMLELLSDAAAEITTRLGTATVDVRLHGRDADFLVTELSTPEEAVPGPPAPPVALPPVEAGELARITLRLPEPVKEQVERAAAAEGISVNSWLVRAIVGALQHDGSSSGGGPGGAPGGAPSGAARGRTSGRRITGYAQA
jgi:Arc-like DNA binding domain